MPGISIFGDILNRMSIKIKIFLFTSIILIISLTSVSFVVYRIFYNTLTEKQMEYMITSSKKTQEHIEIILQLMEIAGTQIGANEIFINALDGESHDTDKQTVLEYEIPTLLRNTIIFQGFISNIHLIGRNNSFYSSSLIFSKERIFEKYSYLFNVESTYNEYQVNRIFSDKDNTYLNTISLVRVLFDIDNEKVTGVLIIDLNLDYLKEMFTISSIKSSEKVILATKDGQILFNYPYLTDFDNVIKENPVLLTSKNNIIFTKVFSEDSMIVSNTIKYSNWKIINIISMKKVLEAVGTLKNIVFILSITLLIIAVILSFVLSHTFTKPIKELYSKMSLVEKGDLTVRIKVEKYDEIGKLSKIFNEMVTRINLLLTEITKESRKKMEMEFQVLQNQINPHFLYNTLDSIKWLALIRNSPNIANMTTSIINLLKYNISNRNIAVELNQELDSIYEYINIQKYRYGDIFEVVYLIPDYVRKLWVLRFILQPIVENSIFHGFDAEKDNYIITLSSYIFNDVLYIEISDNGIGINEPNVNDMLKKRENMSRFCGLGLNNIDERIKHYFGKEYGLFIETQLNQGTKISMKLPIMEEMPKFDNFDL